MCLDTITQRYAPPLEAEQVAWKAFIVRGEHPHFLYRSLNVLTASTVVHVNTWLRAESYEVEGGVIIHYRYLPGFHVYSTPLPLQYMRRPLFIRADGIYRIAKVLIRGVRTRGLQAGLEVLVADEMYVPWPLEEPPKP